MRFDYTLEEFARDLYWASEREDITDDFSGYSFEIGIRWDGFFYYGNSISCGDKIFKVEFDFDDSIWEGIDRESFLCYWENGRKGFSYYDANDDYDDEQFERDVEILYNRADHQEDLENEYYRGVVESLYNEICDWLAQQEEE